MNIGERVRDFRGRENLEEFSSKFGVTSAQISRIENGKSGISTELAIAICDYFNCSLDLFMRGIEHKIIVQEEPKGDSVSEWQLKYIQILEENHELQKKLHKEKDIEIQQLQGANRG